MNTAEHGLTSQRPTVRALVIAAMGDELRPFSDRASDLQRVTEVGAARFQAGRLAGQDVVLVRSGIGLVNGASAVLTALHLWQPDLVISVGSAGGMEGKVTPGDVVVSTELNYSNADAVAFGYVPGQVPGMPARFPADMAAIERLRMVPGVVLGPIASGDVFVAGNLLDTIVFEHPDTVAVDMESAAIAQVCYSFEVPFVSVRGISDMAGPNAGEEFNDNLSSVSQRAAEVVEALLGQGDLAPHHHETPQGAAV
ncbi:5'-methylthioadenosine/adenosylhomocysteine nucleosidase [Propionibacteriaceae bacterium G1746]|uniref:5'-methylthioadenosine/adenosylhomocysteine nucleosidase n=1 Tax=Aestuariimicrobium sp. G57 TaxID=3418485 RepID=UPI003C1372AB